METQHEDSESWQIPDSNFFEVLEPLIKKMDKKPVYSLLLNDKEKRAAEKANFMAAMDRGEDYEPDFVPKFNLAPHFNNEIELQLLRDQIKAFEPTTEQETAVKNAYLWRVNQLIGNLRIAEMAMFGDMHNFNRYNRYIYGAPDRELVGQELQAIRDDATALLDDPQKGEAAREVLQALDGIDVPFTEDSFKVTPELFETVKEAYRPQAEKALEGIDVPERVVPVEGLEIVRRILANLGADQEPHNYTTVPVDSATASVSDRKVKYPQAAIYSKKRFIGLYVNHEIGDHVMSDLNTLDSDFKLARKGLDRISQSGEAKGVIGEQVAYDSIEEFNAQARALTIGMRHLTAALALGVDGQPRNFTEVYKIAEPIFRMYGNGSPQDAADTAYTLLSQRTMKGTQGRGAAYLKDTIYAEGVRKYWKLAQQYPELIPYWNKFKADLSNPRHIEILQILGVLPTLQHN